MTDMTVYRQQPAIVPFQETKSVAEAMVASGFFQDTKSASQAIVKIMAGQEMGFGAFASMTGVSIIQGKPTIGANLIAAKIKASGKYDYRVTEHTEAACEVAVYQHGTEVGRSRFGMDDAKKAGLDGKDNWRKAPRNMLFARAISNAAKWYCPDIFTSPIYTPDELGAEYDVDGVIVEPPSIPEERKPVEQQMSELGYGANTAPEAPKTPEANKNSNPVLDNPSDVKTYSDAVLGKIADTYGKKPVDVKVVLTLGKAINPGSDVTTICTWMDAYMKAREAGDGAVTAAQVADDHIRQMAEMSNQPALMGEQE